MSDLASTLLAFSPDPQLEPSEYDKNVKKFSATVKKFSSREWVKSAESGSLLEALDPALNSVSLLLTLYTLAQNQGDSGLRPRSVNQVSDAWRPRAVLWNKTEQLLSSFDPISIRYFGQQWRELIEFIGLVASILRQPAMALIPIRTAILRLDPSGGTLTTTHVVFMQLCMESTAYAQAVPLLDCIIHSFPPNASQGGEQGLLCADHGLSNGYITVKSGLSEKIRTADVQEYFLLGAMAFLGLGKYDEAQALLEHVLVTPTSNTANGLMLEAYKKYVLAGALASGQRPPIPKTANGNAMRTIRSASKAYEQLTEVLHDLNLPRLLAEIEAGLSLWSEDGNFGLVQKLVENYPRFLLYKLQRTYASIPLDELSGLLNKGDEELEMYLSTLIKEGQVNASIERSIKTQQRVLKFYSDESMGPKAKSEQQQYKELVACATRTESLTEQTRAADHRINLTKEFIEVEKKNRMKAAQAASGEEAMDTSWDVHKDGMDEDVMGDA
ncbi:hypothetical protein EJ05DRAFT_514629 [Pseudovirgaria hyperparasitica]|uniref:COP9 signalosome complex subunit 3 n=1 Tax=Pseudovirgaria hyperparasitica TaxID=470096 RepID=A0A6A6VSW0_9PEZI|nr:uncharacterized protein EJ05DRAFT_514629 [Pseudovirgaria hyperparasitica]KAF2753672.1 hypothetical protein EJ05DRAFT_514629 [Pseudovirgaria hyperparasitica]